MAKDRDDDTFRLGDLPEEITSRGREVWLAGLGALAAVEEEGGKMFNSLVERGEKMEERGRRQTRESREQMGEAAEELAEAQEEAAQSASNSVAQATSRSASQAEDIVTRTVQRVMDRFDVPSRKEVQGLAERVEMLSKQIDELSISLEQKRQGQRPSAATDVEAQVKTSYHVQARGDDWVVIKEGADEAVSTHEAKKEAVESGREIAKNDTPSLLVLHKQDGEVQETITYESA